MKKMFLGIVTFFLVAYIVLCVVVYFYQEKMIFYPEQLPKDYSFNFKNNFEEITIITKDQKKLNSVLFKSNTPKGLIFYLHGNEGSIKGWGDVAEFYNHIKYDVFILDYRGYGKSEGKISGKNQLFSDIEIAYDQITKRYPENKTIILGYSLGTGLASKLASQKNAKLLILQAPYFSIEDEMHQKFSFLPKFLLKYNFETNQYLKSVKSPVIIFHGDKDDVINYNASLKMQKNFKKGDRLIVLKNQTHDDMTDNIEFQNSMKKILDFN